MINILPGSTNQTVDIFIQNSSVTTGAGLTGLVFNSAGLVCRYRRGPTGTSTALALATQTVAGAHSDGGFVEIDATNMEGLYRFDLSDAIVASGVDYVTVHLEGATNMVPVSFRIGLLNLPVDVKTLQTDSGSVGNLAAAYGKTDGEGWGTIMASTTVATAASNTSFTLTAGSTANDSYNGCRIRVEDDVNGEDNFLGIIIDYVGSTKTVTMDSDRGTVGVGDNIQILANDALRPTSTNNNRTLDVTTTGEAGINLDNVSGTLGNAEVSWVDGNDRVDVGSWLGTAVTTSSTTSLPEVDTKSISDDATAANNLELDYDGTGYTKANQVVYEEGAIWIDLLNGAAGSVDFVNGLSRNPVDNIADANTLSASLGLSRFKVAPSNISNIMVLAASQEYQYFDAQGAWINLGGQSVDGTGFKGCLVLGTSTGSGNYENVTLSNSTFAGGIYWRCAWSGTVTLSGATSYYFDQCFGATTDPTLDFGAAVANTTVFLQDYSGELNVENLGASGTDILNVSGSGHLILAASCTGGTINIRGNWNLTNNGSGITINQDARYELSRILSDSTAFNGADIATLITNVPDVISLAAINAEVDTSMVTYGLDHLLSASVVGADITDNSIVAYLASKSATADWDDFVNTTDSLQAISDTQSSSDVTTLLSIIEAKSPQGT